MTSMLASDPWYTSGLFWGAVGAIIGLAGLVLGWVLWRFGPPQRRLVYTMPMSTSLLTAHTHNFGLESSDLKITYQGQELADPYVISVRMDSRSRKDISGADFDQKRPITLN